MRFNKAAAMNRNSLTGFTQQLTVCSGEYLIWKA